ncbi:MAG TPA: hypothetical protein VFJ50_10790 [Gemmatimonadales bacterium]|nr:hypothetical protein [Gemmatimonadales bacterium]
MDRTAEGLIVVVSDQGSGMDTKLGTPGFGVGFSVMRALSTRFDLQSGAAGTTVTMEFSTAQGNG